MATQASHDDIFGASQKVALTGVTFLTRILPPQVCLYFMGVLVQLKGTRYYRFALLPVLLWFAWRAVFVDLSGGNPKQAQMNAGFITHLWSIPMRATAWAVAREPLQRRSPSNQNDKSDSESVRTALWNAWDLMLNLRGIGWNWPRGLLVPKPSCETDSRVVFVLVSAVRLAIHGLGCDACIQTIRVMSPDTFGSLNGGSLFDHTLPPLLELLRAVFVSFLTIWMLYFAIECSYHLLAIVCVILFQQHPAQWPPLFDSPWLSTSLTELWGRRWHQMMRQVLMVFGVQPFGYLFGRLGGLFGAFLVSGILHDIELRSFGRGGNSAVLIGFWVMNGVGVILERFWTKATGRRVGGVWGWIWMIGWLALWGIWVADEWAKAGRFGAFSLLGEVKPSVVLVGFVRRCLAGWWCTGEVLIR